MIYALFLLILSSFLLVFSFPFPGKGWMVWFALVPFFFSLERFKKTSRPFLIFYLWGSFFWIGVIFWVFNVTVTGFIILTLYLSLYYAIFGYAALSLIKISDSKTLGFFPDALFLSCLWVCLEYFKSNLFTGFGWANLGYSQYNILSFIQIADIAGVYGISFLIVFVNFTIFYGIKKFLNKKNFDFIVIVFCLIAIFTGILFYGNHKLSLLKTADKRFLKASVIQGNFPALEKWVLGSEEKILNKYLELSRRASKDNPDIIIWPETAVPDYLNKNRRFLKLISETAKSKNIPILTGAPWQEGILYYNSAVLFSEKGNIKDKYYKIHLVPFGEYFPYVSYFPGILNVFKSGSFSCGNQYKVFDMELNRKKKAPEKVFFSVLICYEDIFPKLVRKFTSKDIDFLVNISDDSWFGKTAATYQHIQSLVFRSVENRISSIRATNTGLSCFVSASGKIYKEVKNSKSEKLFISGYSTGQVEILNKKIDTFYKKYPDIFVYFCMCLFACMLFLKVKK